MRLAVRRYWFLLFSGILAAGLASRPPEAAAPLQPLPTLSAVVSSRVAGDSRQAVFGDLPPTVYRLPPTPSPQSPTVYRLPPTVYRVPATTSPQSPTPTPRPAGTPPRVGLQVGHWKSNELPDELARLRTSSGAVAGRYREVDVNLEVARRTAALLVSRGITVDILPATVPPGYDADAFVALHADGSQRQGPRGFKLATPWRTSRAAQHLREAITTEYATATNLPQDAAITVNMRGYYAFSYRRHTHAVARTTPAVILELGFLTNPSDRALLLNEPERVAIGVANGIIRYLNERDPADGDALVPPEYPIQWAATAAGVDLRAAPSQNARVLCHAEATDRLIPIQERDGWFEVVYTRDWRVVGWVRVDQVRPSGDPLPTPPPDADS